MRPLERRGGAPGGCSSFFSEVDHRKCPKLCGMRMYRDHLLPFSVGRFHFTDPPFDLRMVGTVLMDLDLKGNRIYDFHGEVS